MNARAVFFCHKLPIRASNAQISILRVQNGEIAFWRRKCAWGDQSSTLTEWTNR